MQLSVTVIKQGNATGTNLRIKSEIAVNGTMGMNAARRYICLSFIWCRAGI